MLVRSLLISGMTNKPKPQMSTIVSQLRRRPSSHRNPNMMATHYTRQIILAKMHAENYARSNSIGARLLAETHARRATELEKGLSYQFWFHCNMYYNNKDSNGRFCRTEQDEAKEVITEEELKDWLSSYINYTEEFMRVCNAIRNLTY